MGQKSQIAHLMGQELCFVKEPWIGQGLVEREPSLGVALIKVFFEFALCRDSAHVNPSFLLFFVVCFLLFPLVSAFVVVAATGPRKQHKKQKTKTNKNTPKTLFLQGLGAFSDRGLAKEKPTNKQQLQKRGTLPKSLFVLFYFFLFPFLSSACLLFFLFFLFSLPAFFCCFDSTQLGQSNKGKQH